MQYIVAASMGERWCCGVLRFALGAAGKLASIALEELSKPGKVEGGSSSRGAADAIAAQPPRYPLLTAPQTFMIMNYN